MSGLSDAIAGLVTSLKSVGGHTVTYSRGSSSVSLTAVPTQASFEQVDEGGIVRWEAKDFLIKASDLTFGGELIEPKKGDKIKDENDKVFKVLDDGNLPCFRYSDPYQTMLRVHTKQVK